MIRTPQASSIGGSVGVDTVARWTSDGSVQGTSGLPVSSMGCVYGLQPTTTNRVRSRTGRRHRGLKCSKGTCCTQDTVKAGNSEHKGRSLEEELAVLVACLWYSYRVEEGDQVIVPLYSDAAASEGAVALGRPFDI
ncbi:hypothetical protein PC116_g23061 [Phytophthora cactorum]|uniref:Uncharacterized protein n=1 Tax=Phytophthora cactorum TaxID=29920 RepID=A0A8T1BLB4_9STRA|nr:hypothetical protein PC114_g20202 [Phytophthora cactorum]KAG2905954.1 hypothetical protein PC117_g20629 [Phytophthora cactorum]KAG2984845.1 hypothetical protein PC119_g20285 [Phytophthora cactorum]KAG4044796.1 hypothetical protein PC123_g19781 [Phytophthora cactorum]KAG4228588.1 hypothetical protein PC116_g23061 [Phytophthora cactorum]